MNVAAFDVDGTLTTRDCVVPFVASLVGGRPALIRRLVRHPLHLARAALRRDRNDLKAQITVAALAGRPFDAVATAAVEFATAVQARWLRPEAVAQLESHRRRGDVIVFVSASFAVYLRPLAQLLGVDDVLATELEIDERGRCTGSIQGGNCRGAEKSVRLQAWLDERGWSRRDVTLWAYGDSAGDAELLASADVAHWVGRGPWPAIGAAP